MGLRKSKPDALRGCTIIAIGGRKPVVVSQVRAIRNDSHLAEHEKNVEILWAILKWLDERRLLDEDGVEVWAGGPNGRVVAEGRRRLVRTTGQYEGADVPTSREIAAEELFAGLGATPLAIVLHLRADLDHRAPPDVTEGLAVLEGLLR